MNLILIGGAQMNKAIDMTEGNIFKQILLFSVPLLLGNLFQQIYNATDTYIIGNYIGDIALAAVNSTQPIINFGIAAFMGLSLGGQVVISQAFGASDNLKIERAIYSSIVIGIITTLILMVFALTAITPLLQLMNVEGEVLKLSALYLKIYFLGSFGVVFYNLITGILRALGDSLRPLYFLIFTCFLNIILDILFVTVIDLGVFGVALATAMTQIACAVLTLFTLFNKYPQYHLSLNKITYDQAMIKKIINIGIPSAIQNSIVSFSNVFVQTNINSFGPLVMAGSGSYSKIDAFATLPVMSFAMAITTFVAQNIGAEKYERVKQGIKTTLIFALVVIISFSAVVWFFGYQAIGLFTQNPEVISYGILKMHWMMPFYPILTLAHVLLGALRGAGKTKIPMYITILCWCVIRMAYLAIVVPLFHDLRLVFFGYPLTWTLSVILILLYYHKVGIIPEDA